MLETHSHSWHIAPEWEDSLACSLMASHGLPFLESSLFLFTKLPPDFPALCLWDWGLPGGVPGSHYFEDSMTLSISIFWYLHLLSLKECISFPFFHCCDHCSLSLSLFLSLLLLSLLPSLPILYCFSLLSYLYYHHCSSYHYYTIVNTTTSNNNKVTITITFNTCSITTTI